MYSFKNQTSVTFYKQPACLRSVTWCVCTLCENNISPCPTSHWRLWRWLSWWHFKCYWWTDQQWAIVEPWFIMGTEVLSQEPLLAQRRWLWCAGSSTIGCSSIKHAAPSPVRCWPEWSGMTAGALPRTSCWGLSEFLSSSSSHTVMVAVSMNQPQSVTQCKTSRCNHTEENEKCCNFYDIFFCKWRISLCFFLYH